MLGLRAPILAPKRPFRVGVEIWAGFQQGLKAQGQKKKESI